MKVILPTKGLFNCQTASGISRLSVSLLLDWTAPSVNTERYKHWRVAHRNKQAAIKALEKSIASLSELDAASWTAIISWVRQSRAAMPSPESSASTMQTDESNFNTVK